MRNTATACVVLAGAFLAASASATVIHVPGDYPAIQPALDAAAGGDTVLVAPGFYIGPANRGLDFAGKAIRLLSEAGPGATVISCGGADRAFYLHSGEPAGTLVSGFTVLNGSATQGGCVRCENGVVVEIRDCAFLDSHAAIGGGAVSLDGVTSAVLMDVEVRGNSAEYGGGMMARNTGQLKIEECSFIENTATFTGGLRCETCPTTLRRVLFDGNVGIQTVGAMACFWAGGYELKDCVFYDNHAPICGGFGGANASAALENCTFVLNDAPLGGGVNCGPGSSFTLTRCIIAFQQDGGAMRCEPGCLPPETTYSCVYGNAAGNALCGDHSNILEENPLFCDLGVGDLSLDAASPCLPANNPWGLLIGALGEGCGSVPAEPSSWGRVKALFR